MDRWWMNLIFTLVTALSEFGRASKQRNRPILRQMIACGGGDRRAVVVGRRTADDLKLPERKEESETHRQNCRHFSQPSS